ncbi:RNA-guided endonuclease InsQ/TnpB family protein [Kineothrix sp. MB12-C1]|uniref:RNA-guided endonuclease InsQ/TnpB family protein n=1 Tax=Kineothrix sp. MB12-C1 TaxID=3070215 RepID=UPI0027D20827|nr:transposase [Kineothrix sp. MB12-C1]WMC91824.1 transposase [Kineothrix sp. MB12-C1]
MPILLKSYKTEIKPTLEQMQIINKTIGTCRFVYNFYLAHNKEIYEKEKKFVSGMDFSKWLNNVYLKENPEYSWIKDVSSKSVKQSIMNADRAFKRFFKGQSKFPNFKKKGKPDVKMYFVKTDTKIIIPCERHRIKIPTLGWVRIKEKGYIPINSSTHIIKSGTVSCKAGRYYVSVLIEEQEKPQSKLNDFGIGIDLGVKDFAITSNRITKKNINKSSRLKKLEKQLKRAQRCLSRKYEDYKKRKKKGEATRQNIQKQIVKVQKLHHRIDNIRADYINKSINEIVKTKPSYITIEDLNVLGMMKNKHLSKAVASQKFYEFRTRLEVKCKEIGIELRVVDRWYPSSKLCHECGCIKRDLKLSDREYICECGYHADRDFNASLNLRDAITYKIA